MSGDSRFWVNRYIGEGWSVIPIPKGSKAPEVKDWVNRTFSVEDFTSDSNIGVRLGAPSGHLVDVDLDCPEAVAAAPTLLLKTDRIHGRASTGASHYWFVCEGVKSERWQDVDGKVLVEVRSTGGQTVVPGSTHPSGEILHWEQDRAPAAVDLPALRESARAVATAALLARHWPAGSRHVAARDAAGFLAARELDPRTIEEIIRTAARLAKDEEVEDRARVARDTARTFAQGGKTTGGPTLEASIGKDVVALLSKWYGGNASIHNALIDEMNERHFYVRLGKDTLIGTKSDEDGVVFQPERALYSWYANQPIVIGEKEISRGPRKGQMEKVIQTKFEIWRAHPKRRQYEGITFCPPPRVPREGAYNMYGGLAIEPDASESAFDLSYRYREHIHDNICGGRTDHFDYLIQLLALTVQQPGVPSEIAVVLKGSMGTGKGVFVRNFGAIFGRHYVQLDRTEQVAGKFNAILSGKVVVFADEAFFAGDKENMGSLKRIVTEDTMVIERKGIDQVREPNCVHLFMATNHDWVVNADSWERRFFVLDVSNAKRQDYEYFTALQADLDAGGLRGFLHWLLQMKVDRKFVHQMPRTDELRLQQEKSMAPELKWWKECLKSGSIEGDDPWPERVSTTDMHLAYIRWCDQMKINRRATCSELGRRLAPFLGERKKRHEGWRRDALPLDVARKKFDVEMGTETPWDEEGDEERKAPSPKGVPF